MLNENYIDEVQEENIDREALANVNAIVVWLKDNKPTDEIELQELIDLVSNSDSDADVYGDRYGIRSSYGSMFIFGGGRTLVIKSDLLRCYMLDLLDGLKEEFNEAGDYAVGVAA